MAATPAEHPSRTVTAPRQLGDAARVTVGPSLAGADTAPLYVGERPIVVFRGGLGAATAAERAEAARQRIDALLQEMTQSRNGEAYADSVHLRAAAAGLIVAAGVRAAAPVELSSGASAVPRHRTFKGELP